MRTVVGHVVAALNARPVEGCHGVLCGLSDLRGWECACVVWVAEPVGDHAGDEWCGCGGRMISMLDLAVEAFQS